MATTPNSIITAQTPRAAGTTVVSASALTARTNITGTTGLTLISPTGANGTRIDFVKLVGTGTTLLGIVGIWIYDGTTSRLFTETLVPARTADTTTTTTYEYSVPMGVTLPSTYSVYFSSQVASQLVTAHLIGGDL